MCALPVAQEFIQKKLRGGQYLGPEQIQRKKKKNGKPAFLTGHLPLLLIRNGLLLRVEDNIFVIVALPAFFKLDL